MSEADGESERDRARKAEDDEAREDANEEREGANEEREDANESEDEATSASESASESESESESASASASASKSDPDPDAGESDPTEAAKGASEEAPKKSSKIWWLLPIAVVVEFWVYGHNGYIDVCVGKEGQTDFALAGAERTDENRWKFPRCETRLNLGLRSEHDDKVAEATKVACRGATLFRNRGESAQCERQENGWERQVDARFCPPWDPNYYEHLFWFLK